MSHFDKLLSAANIVDKLPMVPDMKLGSDPVSIMFISIIMKQGYRQQDQHAFKPSQLFKLMTCGPLGPNG